MIRTNSIYNNHIKLQKIGCERGKNQSDRWMSNESPRSIGIRCSYQGGCAWISASPRILSSSSSSVLLRLAVAAAMLLCGVVALGFNKTSSVWIWTQRKDHWAGLLHGLLNIWAWTFFSFYIWVEYSNLNPSNFSLLQFLWRKCKCMFCTASTPASCLLELEPWQIVSTPSKMKVELVEALSQNKLEKRIWF